MTDTYSLPLLQLPDSCLLAVLQCLADDPASACSAARAHSRLHQAAVLALSSISANLKTNKQLSDSVLPYLRKHGWRVGSMHLSCDETSCHPVRLCQLPAIVQLTSLQLHGLHVRLLKCIAPQDVLGGDVLPLKQLRLSNCALTGTIISNPHVDHGGLATALSQLPRLDHLSVRNLHNWNSWFEFPTDVLQQVQQLTYLELAGKSVQCSPQPHGNAYGLGVSRAVLRPLQSLTRLFELRLDSQALDRYRGWGITADVLSGLSRLTCLMLSCWIEPGVLAHKTRLQHLGLKSCGICGATGTSQLLSHLADLQQLTHLRLASCLYCVEDGNPPASAFSALTASSKLQHLDISKCTLPAGVWQHMLPAGRPLPHLQTLKMQRCEKPAGGRAATPSGSLLVSCCPSLQRLDIQVLRCTAKLLDQLAQLSSFSALHATIPLESRRQVLQCTHVFVS